MEEHELPGLGIRLRGERLLLRPPSPADVPLLVASGRRNKAHLEPWNPLTLPGMDTTTVTGVSTVIAKQRKSWREGRQYAFLAFPQKPKSRPVGRFTLNNVVRSAFCSADLGYWVDVDQIGSGFAAEASMLVIDFAFRRLGLHRVQAAVMPRNERSLRVIAKLGFRKEGYAERYLQIAGKWEDHVIFAVTQEEWPVPTATIPSNPG